MKALSIVYLLVASITILMAFTAADSAVLGLMIFVSLIVGYIIAILALTRKES